MFHTLKKIRQIEQIGGPDSPPVYPQSNREAESGSRDYLQCILTLYGSKFCGTKFCNFLHKSNSNSHPVEFEPAWYNQEYITRGGVYNCAVLLYPANAKVAWAI